MKIACYTSLVLLTLFNCSPTKQEETSSADSTTIVQDSTQQAYMTENSVSQEESSSPGTEVLPFSGTTNNFPFFSMEPLSEDSLETYINTGFAKMLEQYDTAQYATITSEYSWERSYMAQGQEGESTKSTEAQSETKIWYFNKKYQLIGYSMNFEAGPDYPYKKSILYLLSNDSLKAISERTVDESEVTVTSQTRVLADSCPRCGISINSGSTSTAILEVLKNEYVEGTANEFSKSLKELIELLKAKRNSAKTEGDDLVFSIKQVKEGNADQKSKTLTYPVNFTVARQIYDNLGSLK